jgi:NAD(P)H-hydrate epimerase
MRRAEALSCARGPLSFYDLMQNAGAAVADAVMKKWKPCRVLVMSGPGNNGGDGYVAAEALRCAGWPVIVGAMTSNSQTPDAAKAAQAWQGETHSLIPALFDNVDLVIDALFGTGLQRPLTGEVAALVKNLNARKIPVIAADFPSGVDGDTGRILGVAVEAQLTVTFFRKKRGHVLLPGATLCGEIIVAETGMHQDVLDEVKPLTFENHTDLWLSQFPFPQPESHKYSRGHALIYGGPVMTGAARLAARAAQRMGAGLVTLAAPENAMPLYAVALESVIVRQTDRLDQWRALLNDPKKSAVLIGPGMGLGEPLKAFVLSTLESRKPCVLDADALTIFADAPDELFSVLHQDCVLTPHEGEFSRLFGERVKSNGDKIERAQKAAKIAGCIVLLKGADTVIASPDGFAVVNGSAPPWLATAGSGDVLAGMITGLLTQGLPSFEAAVAGAWLHSRIAALFGPGLIAEDIVAGIPALLKTLSSKGN